jgi:hypothetical protein
MVAHYKRQTKIGVLLGTIVPVIFSPLVCFLIYNLRTPHKPDGALFNFWEFYQTLLTHEVQLPTFLSLCALSNLPIFFLLLKKNKDWIARGMIYSTLGYTIVYFVLKQF